VERRTERKGDRRRLGHISKQGNVLLRFLLVEAAQVTVRSNGIPLPRRTIRHPELGSTISWLACSRSHAR
jgi:transposase